MAGFISNRLRQVDQLNSTPRPQNGAAAPFSVNLVTVPQISQGSYLVNQGERASKSATTPINPYKAPPEPLWVPLRPHVDQDNIRCRGITAYSGNASRASEQFAAITTPAISSATPSSPSYLHHLASPTEFRVSKNTPKFLPLLPTNSGNAAELRNYNKEQQQQLGYDVTEETRMAILRNQQVLRHQTAPSASRSYAKNRRSLGAFPGDFSDPACVSCSCLFFYRMN